MGIKWNASGGGGVMSPNDAPLADNQSDMTDARFGGHREHSDTAKAQDYTARTGKASNLKKNPVEETIKDVDDMSDVNDNFADPSAQRAKKREFSRRAETSDVQQSNEEGFISKTDYENRPEEDTDAFEPDPSDPNFLIKTRRSKVKGHFGEGQYDNMPNRGTHEGEIS